MSHRFDQVLSAFVNTLTAAALVGGDGVQVFRVRTRALGEQAVQPSGEADFPAVAVYLGQDEPIGELGYNGTNFIDADLQVFTDIWIESTTDDADVQLLKLRRRATNALLADDTLGLSFVHLVIPAGADEPLIDGDNNRIVASYRINWIVRLRLNADDEGDGAFDAL